MLTGSKGDFTSERVSEDSGGFGYEVQEECTVQSGSDEGQLKYPFVIVRIISYG